MKKKLFSFLLALVLVVIVYLVHVGEWHALPPLLMVIFPLIQEIRYEDEQEE